MTKIFHIFKTSWEEEYITFRLNGWDKYYPWSKEFEDFRYKATKITTD